jgi:hypothetical protein
MEEVATAAVAWRVMAEAGEGSTEMGDEGEKLAATEAGITKAGVATTGPSSTWTPVCSRLGSGRSSPAARLPRPSKTGVGASLGAAHGVAALVVLPAAAAAAAVGD